MRQRASRCVSVTTLVRWRRGGSGRCMNRGTMQDGSHAADDDTAHAMAGQAAENSVQINQRALGH